MAGSVKWFDTRHLITVDIMPTKIYSEKEYIIMDGK